MRRNGSWFSTSSRPELRDDQVHHKEPDDPVDRRVTQKSFDREVGINNEPRRSRQQLTPLAQFGLRTTGV
jgi:hypothetical protein